jgi:hypothetical protein
MLTEVVMSQDDVENSRKIMTEEQRLKRNSYMRDWLRKKRGTKNGANPGRPANTPDVLWSKVDVKGPDECWPWIGFVSTSGYGRTWINDKGYYAHRVIYSIVYPGTIELTAPKSSDISGFLLHKCDNRVCCNPNHLFVGNHTDNMRDRSKKGRAPDYSGGKGPRCKLTMEQAKQIRQKRAEGIPAKVLSKEYKISLSSMKSLLANKSYMEPSTNA